MQENGLRLILNIKDVTNENGESYTGYGFSAFREDDREVFRIEDLSSDKKEVEEMIKLITDNDVSLTHFEDLIEDFCV